MRVSTKTRFTVDALVDLAQHQRNGPVALASIGRRQQVSLSYLEQLFAALRRDGIVQSTRGPGGGYTLARASDEISIADVVRAVDDPTADDASEERRGLALSRGLWQRLHAEMLDQMARIPLSSLLRDAGVPVEAAAPRLRRGFAPLPTTRPRTLAPNSVFAFGRSFAV